MIDLALIFNQRLDTLCRTLQGLLSATSIRLVYSDAMSVSKIDSAEYLSSVDAWHPSLEGHSVLANGAHQVVLDQARKLGWGEVA